MVGLDNFKGELYQPSKSMYLFFTLHYNMNNFEIFLIHLIKLL